MSQHLYISGSSARSMSSDSCLSIFESQDPLQDPCVLFMSQQVLAFMSQHPCVSQDPLQDPCCRIHSSAVICISGSSTRSTSSDSCLSIFVSHGFSARSTSPDTCLSIRLYLRILCKIHVSGSMCPIHVSASLYLRLLCNIHVSGSVYKHPYVSQDPLQDLCLRNQVSASICISGTSARSMSPDPYISIHMYLRILCKIHVSGFMSQRPYVSQEPLQDPCLRIHVSASLYLRSFCKPRGSNVA